MEVDFWKSAPKSLLDRLSSPLLFGFVVSWCLWNYKFFVVLFSENSVSTTFDLIATVGFPVGWKFLIWTFLGPLFTTALYIFSYPWPARFVLIYSLHQQRLNKEITDKVENQTLLTEEESQRIRKQLYQLELDHRAEVLRLMDEVKEARTSYEGLLDLVGEERKNKKNVTEPAVVATTPVKPSANEREIHLLEILRDTGPLAADEFTRRTPLEYSEFMELLREMAVKRWVGYSDESFGIAPLGFEILDKHLPLK